ncbi:MAG: leucine--tRNA ligase [Candidatus Berkelbacteria bacterium]|nr:leucine--tRNA ligase [Candidatus Berkelbacteria bacterium]
MPEKNSKNFYCLDMFPYPSGAGLHVGHPRGYSATDVYARFKKLQGFDVIHPMGWDAFGLPAENYAIASKTHPEKIVAENIKRFKKQLQDLDLSYDWNLEINTTDPKYYHWTQLIFLKMFERGLAYEADAPINYCPSCKTGLANEEVSAGKCERCGTEVVRKKIRQWILKITEYADRLLKDLDDLDWPAPIKEMQKNWIGRSEGSEIEFRIKNSEFRIKVFTTRADTLFGCTYLVIAPESEIVSSLNPHISNLSEVEKYIEESKKKSDLERTELQKDKTGVELEGVKAINPINGKEISVFVADYVLANYGTGAVMAVPAHDERDWQFAKKYDTVILPVIQKSRNKDQNDKSKIEKAFVDYGILIDSAEFSGLDSKTAMKKITEKLKANGAGDFTINYKLRDWIFSRQRYWGEPIPIIHCQKCGPVAVPEKNLPVFLPHVENYQPTGDGRSPLANENDPEISDWLNVKCPKCDGSAKRETNTMPQWAGSCWYYIAYLIKNSDDYNWDKEKIDKFLPVNLYVGGAEHAVLHLLYARFWHKVLFDCEMVSSIEPFQRLVSVGTILGIDGQKMSKSRGNVINPDALLEKFGSDAFKMYELYIGPFSQMAKWNQNGIVGMHRFLEKVERYFENSKFVDVSDKKIINRTIKKVGSDIENFNFNTAISSLIVCFDQLSKIGFDKNSAEKFLTTLFPFAPKTVKKIWSKIFFDAKMSWPNAEEKYLADEKILIPIQINGKIRDKILLPVDISSNDASNMALKSNKVLTWTKGQTPKNIFYVPGKIISIVT